MKDEREELRDKMAALTVKLALAQGSAAEWKRVVRSLRSRFERYKEEVNAMIEAMIQLGITMSSPMPGVFVFENTRAKDEDGALQAKVNLN